MDYSRDLIEKYCSELDIPYITDQTNLDVKYFRNRLRHELIPQLEEYNPRFREALLRGSKSLQADFDFLSQVVERELSNVLIDRQPNHVILKLDTLRSMSTGLRWNVLRQVLKMLRTDVRDFDFDGLSRLDEFILKNSAKKLELANNLQVRMGADDLIICEADFEPTVIEYPQFSEPDSALTFPILIKMGNEWESNWTGREYERYYRM